MTFKGSLTSPDNFDKRCPKSYDVFCCVCYSQSATAWRLLASKGFSQWGVSCLCECVYDNLRAEQMEDLRLSTFLTNVQDEFAQIYKKKRSSGQASFLCLSFKKIIKGASTEGFVALYISGGAFSSDLNRTPKIYNCTWMSVCMHLDER